MTTVDIYRSPLALARVEELLRLPKEGLIAKARNPRPNVQNCGALERWHKTELAWTIVRAELGDVPQ